MRLVHIAALMHIGVRFADVLDVVATAAGVALHLRHSTSRGHTVSLLVRVSIIQCGVGLGGHSWLLGVLVV